MKRKMKCGTAMIMCAAIILSLAGCGGGGYAAYKSAYQKMTAPGSLDVDLSLKLVTSEDTVKAKGNMKMNKEGKMYYEMKVNDTDVVQFTDGDKLYSEINGIKAVYSTGGKDAERPVTEGGTEEKDQGTGFNVTAFMEEFATMLEAGKIKEMGLLDPIPEAGVKSVDTRDVSDGKEYTLHVSNNIVEKMFNTLVKEQVSDNDYALSFSNLEDFNCVMHVNKDGILNGMKYTFSTDVTVPEALTGSDEEVISMDVELEVEIQNPGSSVDVPEMSTEGYE